jgi:hypothetical protein
MLILNIVVSFSSIGKIYFTIPQFTILNMFFVYIKSRLKLIYSLLKKIIEIHNSVIKIQEALGRLENRQLESLNYEKINLNEFRVFSQWGEDGIIQYLLRHIQISKNIFVEFGVENYTESNTRFLLTNNNWAGLLIEANKEHADYIKQDKIYWQHNIKIANEFVTKDNINDIFLKNGIQGDIGLLSIDIDGNDYWVWQAINVINPAIVVVEYNSIFGRYRALTIPYQPDFSRSKAHYSMVYWGASLKAFCNLAKQKGYAFVGCNSAGINAFFVREDLKPDFIQELTPEEGYVSTMVRQSRDENGNLIYLSQEEEEKILFALPLVEV